MATHLFIGASGTDFPGDGTFAGFHCEPGDIIDDDANWALFAEAQPDVVARCFDDTSTSPPEGPADPAEPVTPSA